MVAPAACGGGTLASARPLAGVGTLVLSTLRCWGLALCGLRPLAAAARWRTLGSLLAMAPSFVLPAMCCYGFRLASGRSVTTATAQERRGVGCNCVAVCQMALPFGTGSALTPLRGRGSLQRGLRGKLLPLPPGRPLGKTSCYHIF